MPDVEWNWSRLSRNEVRDRGREVVAAALEREGFQAVLDGGIIRAQRGGVRIEVHVRTLRKPVYAFFEKRRFSLAAYTFGALVLLLDGQPPAAFLVPAPDWQEPNALLVDRDYPGLASEPEWGLNLSGKTLPLLGQYAIARTLGHMRRAPT